MSQSFVKVYTRNFSIIMQQAWFAAHAENSWVVSEGEEIPFFPPYIYYMKDGVEEVWENTEAYAWFLDKLVQICKKDPTFFSQVYRSYFQKLQEMEGLWKKNIATLDELHEFIEKLFSATADFAVLYGVLANNDLQKEYQEEARAFREKDVFFAESNAALRRALKNIYPTLDYFTVYVTCEELRADIDEADIKRRDEGFALIPGEFQGVISFETLREKFPAYHFVLDAVETSSNELKGRTAFPGLVSGKVKVIKRTEQVGDVFEGDILVSPMTTPDMLSAMRKSAAFITDEGGITCHAAIIARELQKPCITGTKIATKVLKDGDMVEVDATNGIVRILKRV